MATRDGRPVSVISENRKARHDYHIEDEVEAGIVLTGSEIKSVRAGRVNLRGSYARIVGDDVLLYDAHISPYDQAGKFTNHDPTRPRRLLLKRREINRLRGLVQQKGVTIVPLRMLLKGRWAKVDLGVARGKKLYDKRDDIAKREAQREIDRAMKARVRSYPE